MNGLLWFIAGVVSASVVLGVGLCLIVLGGRSDAQREDRPPHR